MSRGLLIALVALVASGCATISGSYSLASMEPRGESPPPLPSDCHVWIGELLDRRPEVGVNADRPSRRIEIEDVASAIEQILVDTGIPRQGDALARLDLEVLRAHVSDVTVRWTGHIVVRVVPAEGEPRVIRGRAVETFDTVHANVVHSVMSRALGDLRRLLVEDLAARCNAD